MNVLKLAIASAFALSGLVLAATGAPQRGGPHPGGPPPGREAETGYDARSNGAVDQATYDADAAAFSEVHGPADGLGPVYNAASCAECHANPVVGGSSQVLEMRAGHSNGGVFVDHPGGSLIQSRATDPALQERILDGNEIHGFRASTSTLGLGYVEAIADETLVGIADRQRRDSGGRIAGVAVSVPVFEVTGASRIGRFGWKCQHASLFSFAGDAYINEMGVTTPLFPTENTSNGNPVAEGSALDDSRNDDVDAFARFMRASKAPSRAAITADAMRGERLFNQIGCAVCHVSSIETAPTGTALNGGAFVVPDALGGRVIHPYGDFLLHDVGTGDGIVDNGVAETRTMIRTSPLWGLRTRNRYMHDGASVTLSDAVTRHRAEGLSASTRFARLSPSDRQALIAFLDSL